MAWAAGNRARGKGRADSLTGSGSACAVIPAFNEAGFISEVVRRTLPHCEEVAVVDDGSSDATAANAESAGAVVIRHARNLGKGCALAAGFRHARERGFDWIVTLDADLQHLPEEIPGLFSRASRTDADFVIGCRMMNPKGMPLLRFLTNRVTSMAVSIAARSRVYDSQSGFRLIRTRMLDSVVLDAGRFETESDLIIKAGRLGFRIAEAPISTVYGNEKSKISKVRDTLRFLRLMAKYL